MSAEQWRPAAGWEGLYEVSDQGRVRSLPRLVESRWGATRLMGGAVLTPSRKSDGYCHVNLSRSGVGRSQYVHRLVATAWFGVPDGGHEVCHLNGDRSDNRAANLRWDSHGNNMRDAVAMGTHSMTRKVACPRGHALVEGNLRVRRLELGSRICLSCDRASKRVLPLGWTRDDMAHHIYVDELGFSHAAA